MAYIASDKIEVFPSVKRANKQVSARLMSEESVSSIVNKFLDKSGFVITSADSFSYNNPFEFNIHGYYFKVDSTRSIINAVNSNALKIYANIVLATEGNYTLLQGQDDETVDPVSGEVTASEYQGVQFSVGSPITSSSGTCYSLLILERASTSATFEVPAASWYKFNDSSVEIDVDGGIV